MAGVAKLWLAVPWQATFLSPSPDWKLQHVQPSWQNPDDTWLSSQWHPKGNASTNIRLFVWSERMINPSLHVEYCSFYTMKQNLSMPLEDLSLISFFFQHCTASIEKAKCSSAQSGTSSNSRGREIERGPVMWRGCGVLVVDATRNVVSPWQVFEREASMNIWLDVLLWNTAFGSEGDELKTVCDTDRKTSNRAAPDCSNLIRDKFQGACFTDTSVQ